MKKIMLNFPTDFIDNIMNSMDKGVPMIVNTWKETVRCCIISLTIFDDMCVLNEN